MPPQGARGLIQTLLGGRRGSPEVSAVLDDHAAGGRRIQFLNEGGDIAVSLRCVMVDASGQLVAHALGNVAPGSVTELAVTGAPAEPFRCVWWCQDARGRTRLWSYHGKGKRVRDAPTPERAFRSLYE